MQTILYLHAASLTDANSEFTSTTLRSEMIEAIFSFIDCNIALACSAPLQL